MALLISKKTKGTTKYCGVINLKGLKKVRFDSNPHFATEFDNIEKLEEFVFDNSIEDYTIMNTDELPLFFISINDGMFLIDGLKDINGQYRTTVFENMAESFTSKESADFYAFQNDIENYEVVSQSA